jgi:UDP-glucose 4-epimerase
VKQVLVTGAYGFVGRHVARRLSESGFAVHAMGHGAWGREEWREWGISEWHACDVTLDNLITYGGAPALVFHCAGSGSVGFSMTHPMQDYQRTVGTTMAVLEFMRQYTPDSKLVIPSSAGVYGLAQRMPIAVEDPLNPVSPYGLHKKVAEDLCRSYGKHFGIASAIVRLFSVYGEGLRKQLLWDACNKIANGQAEFGGTGEETRDWIHVEDAATLMIMAANAATPQGVIVNGAGGSEISVRDVLERIAAEFPPQPIHFSGIQRPGDPTNYAADLTEARQLGWTPQHQWKAGVSAYARWFKAGAA